MHAAPHEPRPGPPAIPPAPDVAEARRVEGSVGRRDGRGGQTFWSSNVDAALQRTRILADLLDRRFRVPGTGIRFGYDAIIGLVPVVGDTATMIIGLYPVMEARRLKVGKRIIARMLTNLGIDWLIGLVPILDIFLDVAYKANLKNARLLETALQAKAERM